MTQSCAAQACGRPDRQPPHWHGLSVSVLALAYAFALPGIALAQTQAAKTTQAVPVLPSARPGAPNVLVLMLDDIGFGHLGVYGGLIETPNIDRVARNGLSYTNFHATSICSPSRAAFLTGRNPHTVHVGTHMLAGRNHPGYDGEIPKGAGTIAENLRQNGYATFAIGKWDHIAGRYISPAGPFNYWPTGQGFEQFYGFMSAETDNFNPTLWRGVSPIRAPQKANYHLDEDLADQVIAAMDSLVPGPERRPFFTYWATGTGHSPHHAPKTWMEKYRGKFDKGWDHFRSEVLKRQIAAGIVPRGTKLEPNPGGMQDWKSLTPDQKRLYARQMEAQAAMISHLDAQLGRVIEALQARGELDNTMIVITSDNGSSEGGGQNGTFSQNAGFNLYYPDVAANMRYFDVWGGPETAANFATGWAAATNTPMRYWKQTTYEGGIRVPLIVSWPKGIAARGEWRGQFGYISDLTPTILDALDEAPAAVVNGVPQMPFDGQSLEYTFTSKAPAAVTRSQYFETGFNWSLISGDWKIVRSPVIHGRDVPDLSGPVRWELYNIKDDPGETRNLAAQNPAKVAELDKIFLEQARRYNVDLVGNPNAAFVEAAQRLGAAIVQRGGKWTFPTPLAHIGEAAAPPILLKSYTMTADVTLTTAKETGPIFSIGSRHGGFSLYLKEGKPVFALRSQTGELTKVVSAAGLPAGTTKLTFAFDRSSPEPIRPIDIKVTIAANGQNLASQTVRYAMPILLSSDNTFDIGRDDGTTVVEDYQPEVPFPGDIRNVVFDFKQGSK